MRGESRCRSCGAPVVFRRNRRSGRRQILDVEPHPSGRVLIYSDGTCAVLTDGDLAAAAAQGVTYELVRDHHATCPDAEIWR